MRGRQTPAISRHCGLTMLEVVVSLTLTATILLVSLNTSATMLRNRKLATEAIDGQRLAGYYLDEISVLPIYDTKDPVFGLEVGEIELLRSTYDDVDDYQGFEEYGPTFRDGTRIPGYDDWGLEIEIDSFGYDGTPVPISTGTEGSLREIQVHVFSPSGNVQTYRTLVSSVERDLPGGRSYERLRHVELEFSKTRRVQLLVPLRNQPEPIY